MRKGKAVVRLFVGIELEKEIVHRLSQAVGKCARMGSGIRWVKPGQMHLTLRFLGEVPGEKVDRLKEALGSAAAEGMPYPLEAGGIGAFPSLDRPKVLFVSLVRGEEATRQLADSVSGKAEGLGFPPPGEEFHPHVTLGRVKSGQGVAEAVRELREVTPERLGRMKVGRFTLWESRLSPEGPSYTRIADFPLGNP